MQPSPTDLPVGTRTGYRARLTLAAMIKEVEWIMRQEGKHREVLKLRAGTRRRVQGRFM